MDDRFAHLRLIEALLFASAEPLSRDQIQRHLPENADLDGLMEELAGLYANRGVILVRVGARWAMRTAADLAPQMLIETAVLRKPSRAAVETLAIIAYHQPVTRAEIEEIRGVALSRGTLDTLLEAGWIKPRGRRRTPGKPVTWGTTDAFLDQFGLDSLDSLPGVAELKAAGLIDSRPAATALTARGHLLAPGEAGEDIETPEDDVDETPDLELALAEDFGEDLVLAEDSADGETAAEDETAAGAEDGAQAGNRRPARATRIGRAAVASPDGDFGESRDFGSDAEADEDDESAEFDTRARLYASHGDD